MVGMRWGLVGFGSTGPDPKRATFNARSDNLEKSNLWRVPLHKRRCLVPISGYFEWRKPDKVPFRFTLRDQPLYALAGLWDAWRDPRPAVPYLKALLYRAAPISAFTRIVPLATVMLRVQSL